MELSSEQLLQVINTVPIFQGLSDREKNTLLAIVRTQEYLPTEELCREGDRGFSLFIICQGTVSIYKEINEDVRELLGESGVGSMIGQVSLIDGKPRSATVTAKTRVMTLECTRDDFERLFNAGSPFAFKILDQISIHLVARIRNANKQLYSLYSRPTETLMKLHALCMNIQRSISDTYDSIEISDLTKDDE
jgi:CRP/FNR family transcriptional regulator/CRP/FNR family cyclic AMP-dependent transcriptional regulator